MGAKITGRDRAAQGRRLGEQMADRRVQPLQPGQPAPAFELASANRDGPVSLASLRGRPFLIGLFRGLHCPFCRRQMRQFSSVEPALRAVGVETLAVVNTPVERARLYFRFQPTPVTVLADPDCQTHRDFGAPQAALLPPESTETPQWPHRTRPADFAAARINPTGELAEPMHPMQANELLNAREGFEPDETDLRIFAEHGTQLVGHFLVDAAGIISWSEIEARFGPDELGVFPSAAEIMMAVKRVAS